MPEETFATKSVDAIIAHHAEMVDELRRRVNVLVAAVALGEAAAPAAATVVDYLQSTILPHAASEEATLYAAASPFESRLVQSLVADHGTIRRLAAELAGTGEAVGSVATAGATAAFFTSHAAKENDYVLPTLAEEVDADLPGLVHAMHEEFERRQP